MSAKVGFDRESNWRLPGEAERLSREVDEGDLSRDEPRRLEPRLESLPREKLRGKSLDSNPDIIAAMPFRPCIFSRFLEDPWSEASDGSSFEASSRLSTCVTNESGSISLEIWSEDLRGGSSVSTVGRSGELGADAMVREMFRRGDDLRGPAELRIALPCDDEATPPTPVPALLADCGVLSRF